MLKTFCPHLRSHISKDNNRHLTIAVYRVNSSDRFRSLDTYCITGSKYLGRSLAFSLWLSNGLIVRFGLKVGCGIFLFLSLSLASCLNLGNLSCDSLVIGS